MDLGCPLLSATPPPGRPGRLEGETDTTEGETSRPHVPGRGPDRRYGRCPRPQVPNVLTCRPLRRSPRRLLRSCSATGGDSGVWWIGVIYRDGSGRGSF